MEKNDHKLKKIRVLETNNNYINNMNILMPKSGDLNQKDLKILRDYVLENVKLYEYQDPEIIFKAMEWISSQ